MAAALIALLAVGGGFLLWLNAPEEVVAEAEAEAEEEFFVVPLSELPEEERQEVAEAEDTPAVADAATADPANNYVTPIDDYIAPSRLQPAAPAAGGQANQPEPVRSNLAPAAMGPDDEPQVIPTFGVTALSDPTMIRTMVQEVIGRYKGQMKHCYEQRLKTNETLRGTWYLAFTIQASGAVSNVSATGKSWQDAELEACMVRNASKWRFQPLAEPMYIPQYPFRFGS